MEHLQEWIVRVLFYLLHLGNTYNDINRDSNFLEEMGESMKIQITEKYGYLNQTTSIQLQLQSGLPQGQKETRMGTKDRIQGSCANYGGKRCKNHKGEIETSLTS